MACRINIVCFEFESDSPNMDVHAQLTWNTHISSFHTIIFVKMFILQVTIGHFLEILSCNMHFVLIEHLTIVPNDVNIK